MRIIFVATLTLLMFSCGSSNETENNSAGETTADTSGIVEYDLNEERLSAVDFNNKLILIQQRVLDQINLLFTSDSSTVDLNYDNALFEIGLNLTDLKNTLAPDGGEGFKKAVEDLLLFYEEELTHGFKDMKELMKKSDISEEEDEKLRNYDIEFARLERNLASYIQIEQEKFAAENNFKVE